MKRFEEALKTVEHRFARSLPPSLPPFAPSFANCFLPFSKEAPGDVLSRLARSIRLNAGEKIPLNFLTDHFHS